MSKTQLFWYNIGLERKVSVDAVLRDQVGQTLSATDKEKLEKLIVLTDQEKVHERHLFLDQLGYKDPAVVAFFIYISRLMLGSPGTFS